MARRAGKNSAVQNPRFFEQCDWESAQARSKCLCLPKYFDDTDKVEDLESRLRPVMVILQGFNYEQAKKNPFGGPDVEIRHGALVAM